MLLELSLNLNYWDSMPSHILFTFFPLNSLCLEFLLVAIEKFTIFFFLFSKTFVLCVLFNIMRQHSKQIMTLVCEKCWPQCLSRLNNKLTLKMTKICKIVRKDAKLAWMSRHQKTLQQYCINHKRMCNISLVQVLVFTSSSSFPVRCKCIEWVEREKKN